MTNRNELMKTNRKRAKNANKSMSANKQSSTLGKALTTTIETVDDSTINQPSTSSHQIDPLDGQHEWFHSPSDIPNNVSNEQIEHLEQEHNLNQNNANLENEGNQFDNQAQLPSPELVREMNVQDNLLDDQPNVIDADFDLQALGNQGTIRLGNMKSI